MKDRGPSTLIVVVGDSTVADGRDGDEVEGWGREFEVFVDHSKVRYLNMAQSGRSSRSYYEEGLWREVLKLKPNYILIQFGLNDIKKDHGRFTDPDTTFRDYLNRYIKEAREIGAEVILVTPPERRRFRQQIFIPSADTYAKAMREVAAENNVPVLDLWEKSVGMIQLAGNYASLDRYMTDTVHTNSLGAKLNAEFIYELTMDSDLDLKKYLLITKHNSLTQETISL